MVFRSSRIVASSLIVDGGGDGVCSENQIFKSAAASGSNAGSVSFAIIGQVVVERVDIERCLSFTGQNRDGLHDGRQVARFSGDESGNNIDF